MSRIGVESKRRHG